MIKKSGELYIYRKGTPSRAPQNLTKQKQCKQIKFNQKQCKQIKCKEVKSKEIKQCKQVKSKEGVQNAHFISEVNCIHDGIFNHS